MKRIFVMFFAVALIFSFSVSLSEETEIYSTKHFSYAAPSGWHKVESDESTSYYGRTVGSPVGGYIAVMEQEIDFVPSDGEEFDTFFNAVIQSACADPGNGLIIKKTMIDGHHAAVILGALNTGTTLYDAAYIIICSDKHMFCQAILDTEKSPDELFAIAKDLSESISYKGNETKSFENEERLPDPRDYSGKTLRKQYDPYDYTAAKYTPEAYKGTSVCASGRVFLKNIMDDGWGYALFFESKSEKAVYITLLPGSVPTEGIEIGDNIEIYGIAQTLTDTTPSYPIILTTMKIVNHGE